MTAVAPTQHATQHPPTIESDATRRPVVALALLRIAVGFVFLWAFLDKTFGLGYATPAAKAWINGGSPTKGFLSGVEVGPFQSTFQSWAGAGWANTLFMLAMLGVGIAVVLGVALRVSAVAGSLALLFMWAAEWPLAQTTSAGAPSMSSNPVVDYHVIYALALIAVAATFAGRRWGLGTMWERLPLVRRNRWLV